MFENNTIIYCCIYYYTDIMSEKTSEEIIIDFINKNPGCNKEYLVKGLIDSVSRGTIYNKLEDIE